MSNSTAAKPHSQSLVDAVVSKLESGILTGDIAGGTKLLEQSLAARFGVSRAVLREAIRRLEGRKLIVRTPFVGAQVAALSFEDLDEIMTVREVLEGAAARLAAMMMTPREAADLMTVIDRQHEAKQLKGGAHEYMGLRDYDFHYRIASGARNKRLISILCGDLYYLLKIYRFRSGTVAERSEEVLHEHRAVATAIAARDPDCAEALMRHHIRNSRRNMAQRVQTADIAAEQQQPVA
jgi:DNA-binding GntR family transcriptional regulator